MSSTKTTLEWRIPQGEAAALVRRLASQLPHGQLQVGETTFDLSGARSFKCRFKTLGEDYGVKLTIKRAPQPADDAE